MPAAWVGAAASVYGATQGGSGGGGGGSSNVANDIAADQWGYYKANYQPLENNLINQANQAGTPQEYAAAAGRANADVENSFNQVNKQTESRLQSYGINPGSPAYQSAMASNDLAQGAASAGAQTGAYNNQKNLAYSKGLDVVGIGRNIPAQSAASAAAGANAQNQASQTQFYQNQINGRNAGYAAKALSGPVKDWFNNNSSSGNQTYNGPTDYSIQNTGGDTAGAMYAEGYAEGGKVTKFQRSGLAITPHMNRYADGGGVGRQGMEDQNDASNMGTLQGPGTETSDSIPAHIDGQQQAALSKGEFVMSAEVPKLTGEEILDAINQAGLRKRGESTSNDVSNNAGEQAYRRGGLIGRMQNGQR